MEDIHEIKDLRASNGEPEKKLKKALMGGYSKKDVDSMMEGITEEKNKIIKGYEEQICELKTSLSMVVRERDNSLAEKNKLQEKQKELLESKEQLAKQNEVLLKQVEQLEEKLKDAKQPVIPVPVPEPEQDGMDKIRLELEVENEQLFKNNAELTQNVERLNQKIIEITQMLTDERADKKQQILKLQGELHKKEISFRLKTNNILENLNIIIKEVETMNSN